MTISLTMKERFDKLDQVIWFMKMPFRYNVYEKNQGKNHVLNYLQELQAATDHEFRKKKSAKQKRAQLLDLIEDDENYRVTFTNFVVVANTQNSLETLAEGKKGGFVGQSCKWILGKGHFSATSQRG